MAVDLTLLTTDYGDGGVERMLVNTMNGLSDAGVRLDFLVSRTDGPYLDALSPEIRLRELGRRPQDIPRSLDAYLRERRPPRLMTAKLRDDALAVAARRRSGVDMRVYFRVGNPLVHRLRQRSFNPIRRWWQVHRLRQLYRHADACIAVSRGIADDLSQGLGVPPERVHTLPNPTVTATLGERAREPAAHPWLTGDTGIPVVLAAGGLRAQKDFPTLLRAFAEVRRSRACRLIILGRGRQQQRLLRLAARLGVGEDFDLPGWVSNPHAWMARAAVFVLSSRWEGSPNALVEAAALGVPLVATDCISGPREILQGGRYGELVPVGHSTAMADAIARMLDSPPSSEWVRLAAEPYTVARSTEAYLAALGLVPVARQAAPAP